MTRRVSLPTEEQVRKTLAKLREPSESHNVTVRALASALGLTNSTFWRYFPEIAQSVVNERRAAKNKTLPPHRNVEMSDSPEREIRKENSLLRDQLEVAVAQIQRLTIENQALYDQIGSKRMSLNFRNAEGRE